MHHALHTDSTGLIAGRTAGCRALLACPGRPGSDQVVAHHAVSAIGGAVALVTEAGAFLAPVTAVQVEVLDAGHADGR